MNKPMRYSRQREVILDILKNTKSHPGADEIYIAAKKEVPMISLATVYRNLSKLAANGDIISFNVDGTEHFDACTRNHYHLVCARCRKIYDMDMPVIEYLNEDAQAISGAEIKSHEIIFKGICAGCRVQDKDNKQ